MRRWWWVVVAGLAALVAVAVGLIAVVVSGSSTSLLDLEVGDCFDLPVDEPAAGGDAVEVVETVDVIDCDEPHEAEVVAAGELNPDGALDYPSDDELFAVLDQRCAAIGDLPLDRFGIVPIAPTEQSWRSFDGRYLCLAIPFGGAPVTGSIGADPEGG